MKSNFKNGAQQNRTRDNVQQVKNNCPAKETTKKNDKIRRQWKIDNLPAPAIPDILFIYFYFFII